MDAARELNFFPDSEVRGDQRSRSWKIQPLVIAISNMTQEVDSTAREVAKILIK